MKRIVGIFLLCTAVAARAAVVHVFEQTACGGVTNVLTDATANTLSVYVTRKAPLVAGWLFSHWSTDARQAIDDRDAWGRALDAASFTVYEETTLTANYLPEDEDADADGVADAWEIYWYGDLAQTADSDTDDDGLSFAREIARGSNPLFPDAYAPGPVVRGDSGEVLYNPHGWVPYVIRSEPEGALFETIVGHAEPGAEITTAGYNPGTSDFACWTVNGRRVQDPWGRATDAAVFVAASTNVTEAVAWCETDELARFGRYWYGNPGAEADSDTDGDGLTLAQEVARGSNPLFPDVYAPGPVVREASDLVQYNPHGYVAYIIRSEPEGVLFETQSDYLRPGETIDTPVLDPDTSAFSGWTLNGVRQADAWGRALDGLTLVGAGTDELVAIAGTDENEMPRHALYWYGEADVAADSDTDEDGLTLAQEVARGSSPLFPDAYAPGPVVHAISTAAEANLQPFEQLRTALVGGAAVEAFTSPTAGNEVEAWAFGADLSPAVADLDGDGLFDLVLASATGVRVLHNVGALASPDFEEVADALPGLAADFAAADAADRVIAGGEGGVYLAGDPIRFYPWGGVAAEETALSGVPAWNGGELFALDPATGAVATTNGTLALDAPIVEGLSIAVADADGDGIADLLASDGEGRVWFYRSFAGTDAVPSRYELRHKVWGGTFGGFAEGLKIAALDWDDDGDLDALGGTAAGRLLMLRDPRVGRPTNLKAEAGIDTVVLTWDPNRQSRVRGYRVYRAEADAEATEARIAEPQLPAYRDAPPEIAGFDYKVSAVSRFYTAGNSTPTETESPKTEAVRATLGAVRFFWNDANAKLGDRVEIAVSIENALRYDVAGRTESVTYDPAFLRPVEVRTSGLTDGIVFQESAANGAWTVTMTRGVLPAGSGRFLTFVFDTLQAGTTRVGGESGAAVTIAPAGTARYFLGDVDGDGALTVLDIRLLAKLKNGELGRRASAEQIQAGDFNGNGKLDNADYQALRAKLKELGIL